eukprot:2880532-Pleurochrysis_carterae.AAC.1
MAHTRTQGRVCVPAALPHPSRVSLPPRVRAVQAAARTRRTRSRSRPSLRRTPPAAASSTSTPSRASRD